SLVLAGPGEPNIPISQYPNIFNLNWVNPEEKQTLLQNAEALLYPSLYEGFGLPILEAFDAGMPIITSNCASMPEVAGDAALLVNPKNTQEIADAMEKIIKNPDLKNELIQKGKERLKNFSWEKCARQTMKNILT
ncbi:MAG: glycosyltransferase, partial [Patescibacteria group bacterium]